MNKPPTPAVALYTRLSLQYQLISLMVDRARINPVALASGIKAVQVSAKMLVTLKELDALPAIGKH